MLTINLDKYTNEHTGIEYNKHVGPHYCPAEMYAGLVACCPWDSQTDGQTSERYITLSATSVMIEHIKYTDVIAELDGPLYSIRLERLGYLCTSCACRADVFPTIAPSLPGIVTPGNALFLGSRPLIIPNGISIDSAVFMWVLNAMQYNVFLMEKKTPKLPLPFGFRHPAGGEPIHGHR